MGCRASFLNSSDWYRHNPTFKCDEPSAQLQKAIHDAGELGQDGPWHGALPYQYFLHQEAKAAFSVDNRLFQNAHWRCDQVVDSLLLWRERILPLIATASLKQTDQVCADARLKEVQILFPRLGRPDLCSWWLYDSHGHQLWQSTIPTWRNYSAQGRNGPGSNHDTTGLLQPIRFLWYSVWNLNESARGQTFGIQLVRRLPDPTRRLL